MERSALQRHQALLDQLRTAIHEPGLLGASQDVRKIGLVWLTEVRGVGKGHAALVTHPGHGGGGVKTAGERNADAFAYRKRREHV